MEKWDHKVLPVDAICKNTVLLSALYGNLLPFIYGIGFGWKPTVDQTDIYLGIFGEFTIFNPRFPPVIHLNAL